MLIRDEIYLHRDEIKIGYNKLLSDDRRRLDEATLDKLLFIYFNVIKL